MDLFLFDPATFRRQPSVRTPSSSYRTIARRDFVPEEMTPKKVSSAVQPTGPVTRSKHALDKVIEEPPRIKSRKSAPRGRVSSVAAKKSAGRNAPKPVQEVARHCLEALFSDP